MRPNWFIAFPVAGAFLAKLSPPPPNFRLFPPEDLHITLAFLGPCGEASARRAWERLCDGLSADGASHASAFAVTLSEVVPMGRRGRYSALSALLGEGRQTATDWLELWEAPLLQAARPELSPRQLRPAKPHLTLARPNRRATGSQRAAGLRWAAQVNLEAVRFDVAEVALYTWSEARPTRLFRVVDRRPLTATGAASDAQT